MNKHLQSLQNRQAEFKAYRASLARRVEETNAAKEIPTLCADIDKELEKIREYNSDQADKVYAMFHMLKNIKPLTPSEFILLLSDACTKRLHILPTKDNIAYAELLYQLGETQFIQYENSLYYSKSE